MNRPRHRRIHPVAAWALVFTLPAIWIAGVWAHWHGWMPTWALIALAPALLAFTVVAYRTLSRPDLLDDDPLSPWRTFRAVKRVTFLGDDTHDCRLRMELVPEWDLSGPGVTLEFRDVTWLSIRQFDDLVLHFDCLVCRATMSKSKGTIYHVKDRWSETIEFRCRSFEEIVQAGEATNRSSPSAQPTTC
ncbi:MAG: hypothetical protein NXI31_06905 [bacterium]|nr:hypothetical protein [bacterium]